MTHKFEIGQRVQLSREGLDYVPLPSATHRQRRGTVTRMITSRSVSVKWDQTKKDKAYHPDLIEPIPDAHGE